MLSAKSAKSVMVREKEQMNYFASEIHSEQRS